MITPSQFAKKKQEVLLFEDSYFLICLFSPRIISREIILLRIAFQRIQQAKIYVCVSVGDILYVKKFLPHAANSLPFYHHFNPYIYLLMYIIMMMMIGEVLGLYFYENDALTFTINITQYCTHCVHHLCMCIGIIYIVFNLVPYL